MGKVDVLRSDYDQCHSLWLWNGVEFYLKNHLAGCFVCAFALKRTEAFLGILLFPFDVLHEYLLGEFLLTLFLFYFLSFPIWHSTSLA
jgi:hypothetical protein